MATEAEKYQRLLKVFNISFYSLIEGLWDLFGESSYATANVIGDKLLDMLEKESGLEIHGENPNDILQEVIRLLVDEIGIMKSGSLTMGDDGKVSISCEQCIFREATMKLEKEGVQPFACTPMIISAAAMRKRLGTKHHVSGRNWDPDTQTCTINFKLV